MQSSTLKGGFFVVIVFCIIAIVIYTVELVNELRQETRGIAEVYSQIYLFMATKPIDPETLGLFFEITQKTIFPMILTDNQHNPSSWKGLNVPDNDSSPVALKKVHKMMEKLKKENKPLEIKHNDQILHYLYYGDSKLITQLVYLPYITLCGLGLLVLTAFFGFSSIKTSEQRFIWVGMAKETAHQLGTPISSLLGWIELIKTHDFDKNRIQPVVTDMESDVQRLEKVAARFSQIGSTSELKKQDIHPILKDIIIYFHRRLPQSGKEIKIIESFGRVPPIPLNRDLFEWAIENLIKNAIDAIKNQHGVIEIRTGMLPENKGVFIDICDNGIGIKTKDKRHIFKAGYSTKTRGWGLGLNFTKRIIEDYHNGKIFIKETHVNKGTTMRIIL
jgi:hypothetical protein